MINKNLESSLFQHLLEFADQMKRGGDSLLFEYGITSQQWLILLHLANDPNLPFFQQRNFERPVLASELAGFFNVSRANITNLINVLSEKKLIMQVSDSQDRRRKLLQLSEEGRELVQKLEPLRKAANENLFASFSPEEKELFLRLVERSVHYMVKLGPKPLLK